MTQKSVKSIHLCKSVIQTILSYDIVKAHGGELTVISTFEEGLTNEGSTKPGTEFKVSLPI